MVKVAVEITDLKAKNAKLRGFVEAVADRTMHDTFWTREAQDLLAEIDLDTRAQDLLAEIDKGL